MKTISIVTPCCNEEENVKALVSAVGEIFQGLPDCDYEHIFIDNSSTDRTLELLREICRTNPRVKVIVNSRNFGHIRSPYHGLIQASGDAVVLLAADFQDPPGMIAEFVREWQAGQKIVLGQKNRSKESRIVFALRKLYYRLVRTMSDVELIDNFTGFGLYDRSIIEILRNIDDPYPYFRGIICEIGFEKAIIRYTQPKRRGGKTKNNFATLFDMAMTGFTSVSRVPMRIASICGFVLSALSVLVALAYLVLKLIYWDQFEAGTAPILIGIFFFSSVQLFFIGVIGEYVASINTRVIKRPRVVEKERINFD